MRSYFPCGLHKTPKKWLPILCDEACRDCGFNQSERDRRLKNGEFVHYERNSQPMRSLRFPPAPILEGGNTDE